MIKQISQHIELNLQHTSRSLFLSILSILKHAFFFLALFKLALCLRHDFFYCPCLSSIHERANCIAMLWTGHSHLLRSCHFRGVWATCLPHKDGDIPLSALAKDTTSELAGLFSTTSPKCRATSRKDVDSIFYSLLKNKGIKSRRRLNTRSIGCEANALTTTPLRRFSVIFDLRTAAVSVFVDLSAEH